MSSISSVMLHTINAAPDSPAIADCVRSASKGDAILLLGDGVYSAIIDGPMQQQLSDHSADVYVLREDAAVRGVLMKLCKDATLLDMDGFVTLTEQFPCQQAWF